MSLGKVDDLDCKHIDEWIQEALSIQHGSDVAVWYGGHEPRIAQIIERMNARGFSTIQITNHHILFTKKTSA